VERIMRKLGANVVQVHTRGVRDGLMLTMVQQLPTPPSVPTEDRRAAVEEFAKNCGVDLPHARQVARIAGSLWQQLAGPLKLNAEDRELIESAALIANVGYLINFDGHHKHSYHLILNSELPGFERRQLQILANVARYHRGTRPKKRHENFSELSAEDQQRVCALAAILRLALALDRTHQQHVGEVRARVRDDVVGIVVQSQDEANVDLWAAERKVDLFEKVFRRKVRFSARETNGRPVNKRSTRSRRVGRSRGAS
jgi:exopolyphosphatase / guanosine-5'-triphosphate,3'-diphosphate pyrophosphatase